MRDEIREAVARLTKAAWDAEMGAPAGTFEAQASAELEAAEERGRREMREEAADLQHHMERGRGAHPRPEGQAMRRATDEEIALVVRWADPAMSPGFLVQHGNGTWTFEAGALEWTGTLDEVFTAAADYIRGKR